MVKEYFLAPNFTTAPPPEGPIKLGSILRNVTEFDPMNIHDLAIPTTQLYPADIKEPFEISLHQLHSSDLSLKARALELLDLGTGASIRHTRGNDSVISCKSLETHAFNPTESYMNQSMQDPGVRVFTHMNWRRLSVYMVTGLKVARGASSTSSTSKVVAMEHDTSLLPSGAPVAVGVKAGYASGMNQGERWDRSTDFILAFKVKKIWLNREDEVQHQPYTKKAVMQDGTAADSEIAFTVHSDDNLTTEEVDKMLGKAEDDI
ncbi:major facilitator superfamily MFS-1 [Fusarium austroafricanum]|uniref:Major facilitator superfamily MFS-1 n=1 Tax=Fusarium austroafricanum TaxID=2364996 RepID=A0A8H4KH19_9HYPO|nr:major facilitator superfamily MFS-1 [Fusarium austroafricanum]